MQKVSSSTTGQKLYQKAKKLIPGGTQLLSKRPEMFLPDLWPAYYDRAKGCEVYDLDGNRYYDFAQMGVGSCTLGYADEDVNRAAMDAVSRGSMCSLNAPEEVALAEKLIEIHPWAEMVRFSRTGGEACSIAIRIGRAASGRAKVAFCGYHGWHDWYLAANLAADSNLDGQLLPGLQPKGVARGLRDTALPFNYNKPEELEALANKHPGEIGVIMMEPQRGVPPAPGFLQRVREIATRIGAVLIFDEITSGFRVNYGGIHLTHAVEPDIAVFGKALGNGFACSAIIGRASVMQAAQETFISSTYWTERVGSAAALATLQKMQRVRSWEQLVHHGKRLLDGWTALGKKHGVALHAGGIPPLAHIGFDAPKPLEVQTLYTQEMFERGYLLGAAVYTTVAYTDAIIDRFLADSDEVFPTIRKAVDSGDVRSFLKASPRHSGFARLSS